MTLEAMRNRDARQEFLPFRRTSRIRARVADPSRSRPNARTERRRRRSTRRSRTGRRNITHRAFGARLTALLMLAAIAALGIAAPHTHAQSLPLHVVVNGQPVRLAADAIIQNGIIMAPYQGLFEPMGIRAVWSPPERVLTLVTLAGDEMQLRPDDPYAMVNGERRPIPIPLVDVLGQILIPVQWVFDTLGDATVYDPSARTLEVSAQITAISWRAVDTGMEITLEGTAPLHATATSLRYPDRAVVDVIGALPKLAQQSIDVHEGPIGTIRIGQSSTGTAAVTRVVFDLTSPAQPRLRQTGVGRRAVLLLAPAQAAGGPGYTPSALRITDVAYEHMDGGGRVLIAATQPVRMTQHVLRNPDRIVLDVNDAVFIPVKKAVDVDDGLVVQVRAAQFHRNPNIVRIVVELTRPAPYAVRVGTVAGQMLVDLGAATAGPGSPGAPEPRGPAVVAIDAGHGGSDPGAIGPTGLQEKDVTLAIAQALRTLLRRQRIDVVMVRDADIFIPLEDRAQIAARAGATLFISIHANGAVDANANGAQVFYAAPQSVGLATALLDEMSRAADLAPRGVTEARFKVLVDNPRIPAVLVETGFISNPREEQMLRNPATQQAFAQGLLRGIVRYLTAPAASPQ